MCGQATSRSHFPSKLCHSLMYPGPFRVYPRFGVWPCAYPPNRPPGPPAGLPGQRNPRGTVPGGRSIRPSRSRSVPPRPSREGNHFQPGPYPCPDNSSQFWQMLPMQPDLYGVPVNASGVDAVSSNPFFRALMQQQEAADHALKTRRIDKVRTIRIPF